MKATYGATNAVSCHVRSGNMQASARPSEPIPACPGGLVAMRDVIPECELRTLSLDCLEEKYISRESSSIALCFEDMTPLEMEVILPTTDSKLNYLSRTRRLASAIAYGRRGGDIKTRTPDLGRHTAVRSCVHAELLDQKRERFAAVVNRFLDLHQILRG
ncbi:DNA packaging protein UL33 [Leporid alphaherpesvirus 4]|uniref:DNA packaging protein UL33 n=1 Tax=Leporid alphaherpesvirus 4 TaxID=481315 RepID=J9QWL6_9ALPH|nr:DNA packaging protein UL33 [Leporid alphaherpesvirus 4]AFR32474.1 DNA packaging protein UL33 [Leporid alphaherpesvirus 4]